MKLHKIRVPSWDKSGRDVVEHVRSRSVPVLVSILKIDFVVWHPGVRNARRSGECSTPTPVNVQVD